MSEHIREIFDTTLHDEPPLVDMVGAAVEGARRRTRRDRVAMAVTPLAVLALGAGAYGLLPGSWPTDGRHPADPAARTSTRPVFPPVAGIAPLNPTPQVHQAALTLCTRDWTAKLATPASNTLPVTNQQGIDMCTMSGETLMTLIPDAKIEFPPVVGDGGPDRPGDQWMVTTPAGRTIFAFWYLWPDSAYEKKHYGPFDECQPNPVDNPPATWVSGPDGKPMQMRDQNAGHNRFCFQTRPAQQFYGALTLDYSDTTLAYSVVNPDYGRYWISTSRSYIQVPESARTSDGVYGNGTNDHMTWYGPDPKYGPALTPAQWSTVLTDPRFNDFLVRYENYVLTHASADSFVVSGSRPVAK